MAVLVSDVTAQVRMHESDFPLDSDSKALLLVNLAHADIVRAVRLYPITTFNINVVNGTQEYTLDSSIYRIWSALWVQDANTKLRIYETSIDWLDYNQPNWRMQSPSNQPYQYYEQGGMIGFVSTPNVTTSTYPYVLLECMTAQPFASISSALPPQVPTVDAWVWGVCARWSAMQRRDDAAYFSQLATSARNELISFVNGRLPRQKPMMIASYPRVRNL